MHLHYCNYYCIFNNVNCKEWKEQMKVTKSKHLKHVPTWKQLQNIFMIRCLISPPSSWQLDFLNYNYIAVVLHFPKYFGIQLTAYLSFIQPCCWPQWNPSFRTSSKFLIWQSSLPPWIAADNMTRLCWSLSQDLARDLAREHFTSSNVVHNYTIILEKQWKAVFFPLTNILLILSPCRLHYHQQVKTVCK